MRAALILLLLATQARADRLAPFRTREAVLGCWDVGAGATLVITAFGKHSIKYSARFTETPRGGPKRFAGDGVWVESAGQFEVPCRPRSQHGSFCRIAPDGDTGDKLAVAVFAHPHDDQKHGNLVEKIVAQHCRKN